MAVQQQTSGPGNNALWATFQLNDDDYCVSTEYVLAMTIPESIKSMPNNADHMLGVMPWHGGSIPLVEMRRLLGFPTLADSVSEFTTMRRMHLDWIEALEDSVRNHTPFEKAIDPHKCMFGKWYDQFTTDNLNMRFILSKIGPPHEYIHLHGAQVKECMQREDWAGAEKKYQEAYEVCTKEVLPLLDAMIEAYKEANKGIAVVVQSGGSTLGLLVDEMNALIPMSKAEVHDVPAAIGRNRYIKELVIANDRTYAALDVPSLAQFVDSEEEQARDAEARAEVLKSYRGAQT